MAAVLKESGTPAGSAWRSPVHRAGTPGRWAATILAGLSIIGASACGGADPTADLRKASTSGTAAPVVSPGAPAPLRPPAVIRTGGRTPTWVTSGAGSLWVSHDDGSVARVDPRDERVVARIPVARRLGPIAYGYGAVWTTDLGGNVYKIDPDTNKVSSMRRMGAEPNLAVGGGAVWVTHGANLVSKIDPESLKVLGRVKVDRPVGAPVLGDSTPVVWKGSLWVPHAFNKIARIDTQSLRVVDEIEVGYGPRLFHDQNHLWAGTFDAATRRGSVSEIHADSSEPTTVVEGPWNVKHVVASGEGQFWIRPAAGVLLRVLADEGTVNSLRFSDRGYPGGLHYAFGSLWAVNSTKGSIWRITP